MKSGKVIKDRKKDVPYSEAEETREMCMSRRKFLGRGAIAVGAAGATVAATGGLGLLSGQFANAQTPPPTCGTAPGVVKHPWGTWGYTPLDADAAAERAYHGWYQNACCWAVCDAVLGQLQETLGSPYTNIDLMAFKFGAGGINGWGTVCGTPLGGSLCTNIIAGPTAGPNMSKDLLAYYSVTALPVMTPVSVVYPYTPPASASVSPLCHVSVGKWMKLSGFKFGTAERSERCARLSGDMAKKTVELLNAWHAGTYSPGAWGGPTTSGMTGQNNCTDCHGTTVPNPLDPSTW